MKPATTPCAECPWRNSNRGRRHPHGWWSLKNVRRLWSKLRAGEPGMSCHPTDPNNAVPDGHKAAPEENEPTECAGLLLLVQRELRAFTEDPENYNHRRGLTKEGMIWWGVARCAPMAGSILGGPPMPIIEEDPDIQLPA